MSDLLGYMSDAGKFICANCAGDEYENDDTQTPAFQSDEWFDGEICDKCSTLVERAS
jgi:hypothetical protein